MNEQGLSSIFQAARKRPLFQRVRLLEAVVKQARDAIVITEAEPVSLPGPRIVYVNPAFTARTGYSSDEVLGRTPRLLQGPETDPLALEKIRHALRAWQPIEIELLNYRKDGTKHWVELSIAPVADETGFFTNWISVQRDLTERKAIYESLTIARIGEAQATTLALEAQRRGRLEEQLALSTIHDDLTGLRNRRFFIHALQDAIDKTRLEKRANLSLLVLNIDRFRDVVANGNDTSNSVLLEVASRLRSITPKSAVLARMGADEFAVLVYDCDGTDANVLATHVAAACGTAIATPHGSVTATFSVGITTATDDSRNAETLLRDSAIAMHRVKSQGGHGILTFTDSMEAEASQVIRVNTDLRLALEREEFVLNYQPIVDVSAGRVAGFEALLRWRHPTRGLVPPLHFIPQAEETGLIVPIGAWVLKAACETAVTWQCDASPLSMSVNVTSQQLLDDGFYAHLRAVLEETRLRPELLQLEVTESVLLAGPAIIGPLFKNIRSLGVKIAFDDFGTGYSSLAYLERFQIDTLKIDKSFVDQLNDTFSNTEIVRMMLSLAHALGLKVIAEGIESESQSNALSELGCTDMQGYLFSRPLPEEQITEALRTKWLSHRALIDAMERCSSSSAYGNLAAEKRTELTRQVKAAIVMHHTWITRVSEAIETGKSEFDIAEVAREDQCSIGKWLSHDIDEQLRKSPLYTVTRARHAVFHRSAARMLALAVKRDPDASGMLAARDDFDRVASLMLLALEDWLSIASQETNQEAPALGRSDEALYDIAARA